MGRFSNAPVDRAAGGVVLHHVDGERVVAVVHRPRHDDWSLPKGHLDDGESWQQAARREVTEETGWEVTITGEPTAIAYVVDVDLPKIVMFYPMALVEGAARGQYDANEVDEVAWWSIDRARRDLTYSGERQVLATFA